MKLKKIKLVKQEPTEPAPVPEARPDDNIYDPMRDGITQSRINTWRDCPTKARIQNMGIISANESEAIVFGSVFHEGLDICQNMIKNHEVHDETDIIKHMNTIINRIEKHYAPILKEADSTVRQTYEDCICITEIMLPRYFDAWKTDFFGENKKKFLFVEEVFRVGEGYALPLQGKIDSAYEDPHGDVWLMENKTKGQFNEESIASWVERDLQVNMYLTALELMIGKRPKGVMYNIIRRPLLRKKVTESKQEFFTRIDNDIKERPTHYFCRLEVSITKEKNTEFKRKLKITVQKYRDWVYSNPNDDEEYTHNCINMYGACKYLKFCESGKTNFDGLTTLVKQNPEL